MTITFRPAVREGIGIFIGLAGESGSGKTWSAMDLATGIVGPGKRFVVLDTENKRARHYADDFDFDVHDMVAPYTSASYAEAVKAAFAAGYGAIVVDSGTHEHDGEGGYLDAQRKALDEMTERYMKKYRDAKEWEVREKLTPSSWIEPKLARKRMMYTMLACSSTVPVIFCFRAEEKVFGTKDGKLVAFNPPKWQPICGKGMPYEMTVSFILHADRPGYPNPIKLPEKLKDLFPLDKPINRESGRRLAEWAKGGTSLTPETQAAMRSPEAQQAGAEAAQRFADADASGDTQPRMPNGLPTAMVDRAVLKGKITAAADKAKMPAATRAALAKSLLGGGTMDTADLSAVQDLLAAVRKWTPNG